MPIDTPSPAPADKNAEPARNATSGTSTQGEKTGNNAANKTQELHLQRNAVFLLAIVTVILVAAALKSSTLVSSTIALSFFITLATWPVDDMVRKRVPEKFRWLGHLAAAGLMLLVFAIFLGGLVLSARQIIGELPQYESLIADEIHNLLQMTQQQGLETDVSSLTDRLINPVVTLATTAIQSTSSFAGILSLIFFLVLLMLFEAPRVGEKLAGSTLSHESQFQNVLITIAERLRWYLAVRTLMGVLTGALYFLWSWIWGLDFTFVWALLAFLLNYVPTIGSLLAGLLPIALAFLVMPLWSAVAFAGGLIVIEQFMGNYLDPKLQGQQLALSPVVILISLLFWSWMWGIAGALVAVPMTTVILIVCERFAPLMPIALFLSNRQNQRDLKASLNDKT